MIRLPNDWVHEPSPGARVFAAVATGVLAVSSGVLTVSGLVGSTSAVPGSTSHAAHVYDSYTATRSLVLLAALLWCVVARKWGAAAAMLALNGLVQLMDAPLGIWQHDAAKTIGPACCAVLLGVAAGWLLRCPAAGGAGPDGQPSAPRVHGAA